LLVALIGAGLASVAMGCDSKGPTSADHNVYFEGNVYDGSGAGALIKTQITSMSMEYRDKLIRIDIDDSGRYTTKDPLPTWQDYMVTIMADGFRPFVSHNPGFDVPASLAKMQQGLADISTTQTFDFDAYLFPTNLMAPAMTIMVGTFDDTTGAANLGKAAGTIRLRPTTQSSVQVGTPSRMVWANDNDLLTSTITDSFMNGKYDVPAGKLVYGVTYEVSIYDVPGYQVYSSATDNTGNTGSKNFVAGNVGTRTFQLQKLGKDPLRIVSSTATMCTPPAPTATTPGAQIVLTFSEPIEAVGTTYPEELDNNTTISEQGTTTFNLCPLKSGFDPTKQERGTSVAISGSMMTFAWNPSVGLTPSMDMSGFTVCTTPTAITTVNYGISTISVQPVGDPSRKASLPLLLQQLNPTGGATLTCPGH
jgi:hypothetical protein